MSLTAAGTFPRASQSGSVETPIITRRATVQDLDTLLADVQAGFGS